MLSEAPHIEKLCWEISWVVSGGSARSISLASGAFLSAPSVFLIYSLVI